LPVFSSLHLIRLTADALRRVLTRDEKRAFSVLMLGGLLTSLLDAMGVAAMLPVMLAALQSDFTSRYKIVNWLYAYGQFSSEREFLLVLVSGLFVFYCCKNILAVFILNGQARLSYRAANRLTKNLLLYYLSRPYPFHKRTTVPDMVNNTINGPGYFASGIILSSLTLWSELTVVVVIAALVLLSNPLLMLTLMVVMGPTVAIIYGVNRGRLEALGQKRQDMMVEAYTLSGSTLRGVIDIRLSNSTGFFTEAFARYMKVLNDNNRLAYTLSIVPARSMETVVVLGMLILFGYILFSSQERDALAVYFALFGAAAFRLLPSLNRIMMSLMSMRTYAYTIEQVDKPLIEAQGAVERLPWRQSIELANVGYQFDDADKPVLSNISFTVRKGDVVGFIGESGSGKTTLLQILLRLYEETSGEMLVDGKRLGQQDVAPWQKNIGYVGQDIYLLDGTLRENIALGVAPEQVDQERLADALRIASLESWVRELPAGLDTNAGEFGRNLSGGQRQRIAIARALYKDASVLIFDEATSALDPETEAELTDSIRALADRNRTIFLIAHRYTTLRACDYILELRNGRIVDRVTYPQLLARYKTFREAAVSQSV
jgi:ATP-binding cassette, subfamily B, bacterial PglK